MDFVEEALNAAEAGEFYTAAAILRTATSMPVQRLADLHEALQEHIEARDLKRMRTLLDGVARANEAVVALSTFGEEAPADPMAPWNRSGDGFATVTARSINLETLVLQNIALEMREPIPPGRSVVVHLLLHFRSNVGNNFYLKLQGPQSAEAFRFTRTEITACSVGAICQSTTSIPTLVTLVVSPTTVSMLLNGALQARKRRLAEDIPRHLTLELLGDRSADLGALIEGIEVWSSPRSLSNVFDADDELVTRRLDAALAAGDAARVYLTLNAIDDLTVDNLDARLPLLLEKLLTTRPYRKEILDFLLGKLSSERAASWIKTNGARFPSLVIRASGLVVQFATEPNRLLSLGRILRRSPIQWFNVLDGIDFEIYEGDILGIIGENGAGKSTLLRTLCGLIPLKKGEIFIQGRPVLLRAGVGFREEASGRENIFLAGAYLGMDPRHMAEIADEIIDFAELREAIDRPFKFYSDGMKTRLMFSLATTLSPQILLLDEPLNAGDTRFRDKATRRMDDVIQKAKTVVMVTHGVDLVRTKCTRALYIVKGRQRFYGDPTTAVNLYLNDLHLSGPRADA